MYMYLLYVGMLSLASAPPTQNKTVQGSGQRPSVGLARFERSSSPGTPKP